MADAAENRLSPFREDLDALLAGRREPAFLGALRRGAFERFELLGLPGRRHEAWRFTDVGALLGRRFRPAPAEQPVDAALANTEELHADAPRLVFVNGRLQPGLCRLGELPRGVRILSLEQALAEAPERLRHHLDRVPGLEDSAFAALNTAFMSDGAVVWLEPGAALEAPLQLVFVASGEDCVSHPRNLLVLGEGSRAVVVEEYRGEGAYWSCPLTEMSVGDGAQLRHYKVQEEAAAAWHLGGLRLALGRDARANLHSLSTGGLLARTDIAARLDGEGAECEIDGLVLASDRQLGDHHLRVEHARPRGRSVQLFKSVLDGRGRSVFDGVIHVHPGAQQTDARQSNRNLLLSPRALANSNPRLEILADDVKCSHGSTTGFLDPDALYYLRSRGIGEAEARAMLVQAFAQEMIDRITLEPLRERLSTDLLSRLGNGGEEQA